MSLTAVACALLVWAGSAAAQPPMPSIAIGVISSRNSRIGQGHEDSIKLALQQLGDPLSAGPRQIQFRLSPEYWDDEGDPAKAQAIARDLAANKRVAAILGPVSSRCTKAVVGASLGVPVISSLSTAPSLTDNRDAWFFRATLNDRERMNRYAHYLTSELGRPAGPHLALYESDEYGEGLKNALSERLGPSNLQATSWNELSASGGVNQAALQQFQNGQGLTPAFRAGLATAPNTVFLLGSTEGAVAIAAGLSHFRPFEFFFVGSDRYLSEKAPEGAHTIGEPFPASSDAPDSKQEQDALNEILKEFREKFHHSEEDFVLTAYEAAHFVLPGAVRRVVEAEGAVPADPDHLRDKMREALEAGPFQSLSPWREIRFSGGSLVESPPAPIYRIWRRLHRWDVPSPRPWVKLVVPESATYLQGPVELKIEPHGFPGGDIELRILRVDDGPGDVVKTDKIHAGDMATSYTFYPTAPGRFRFTTTGSTRLWPQDADVVVTWTLDYLWSLLAALGGSLFALLSARESSKEGVYQRLAVGVGGGLLLTAISFHRHAVPQWQWAQLLSVSPVPIVNAVATGFIGGLMGPNILNLILKVIGPMLPGAPKPST